MTTAELLVAAENAGVSVQVAGDEVRVRYQERRREEIASLIEQLRFSKQQIIALLVENRFTHLHAFINRQVWTPRGKGKLVKVTEGEAIVEYEGGTRMLWVMDHSVIPMQ